MDYITVKEYAGLKGCSVQYIKKIVKDGKIEAIQQQNPQNNKMQYMVPVSALPANLQGRYYARIKSEAGLPPVLLTAPKQPKKTVKRAFEEYSEAERGEIAFWCKIVEEWQNTRAAYKDKTKIDPLFVGKCQLENPDVEISVDILYRRYKAYRENDFEGLIDKRGGWNKGYSKIDDDVWKMFTKIYLHSSQPKVSRCYADVVDWVKEFYPEQYPDIPSERSFRRRISEIPACVIDYARKGKKSCFDNYIEYIERDYTDLQANEIWIADNHTLDIVTIGENGKPHRPSITTFMDAKSGVITCCNLCDNPSSQSTLLAIRSGAQRGFGIPMGVYFDNGSEFLTHDIAGRGHRTKASWNAGDTPPTILSLLGVTMINALVKNAKAKNIERYFYTFKEWISKIFSGYCGGTILERPEDLNKLIKAGQIPTDDELREVLWTLIDGGYNAAAYGGKEHQYKGMSRIDVWNESINCDDVVFRDASDEDLTLLLARSTRYQKIKRNGVFIEVWGKKVWYKDENAVFNVGKEVYVRYDPANLAEVRVYDKETDCFLWTYPCADYLSVSYHVESDEERDKLKTAMSNIRRSEKAVKKRFEEYTSAEGIDIMAARINSAKQNLDNFEVKRPSRITPITAAEVNAKYPNRGSVVSVEFADLKTMNDKREKSRRVG